MNADKQVGIGISGDLFAQCKVRRQINFRANNQCLISAACQYRPCPGLFEQAPQMQSDSQIDLGLGYAAHTNCSALRSSVPRIDHDDPVLQGAGINAGERKVGTKRQALMRAAEGKQGREQHADDCFRAGVCLSG